MALELEWLRGLNQRRQPRIASVYWLIFFVQTEAARQYMVFLAVHEVSLKWLFTQNIIIIIEIIVIHLTHEWIVDWNEPEFQPTPQLYGLLCRKRLSPKWLCPFRAWLKSWLDLNVKALSTDKFKTCYEAFLSILANFCRGWYYYCCLVVGKVFSCIYIICIALWFVMTFIHKKHSIHKFTACFVDFAKNVPAWVVALLAGLRSCHFNTYSFHKKEKKMLPPTKELLLCVKTFNKLKLCTLW